jgi:hypothetical protein
MLKTAIFVLFLQNIKIKLQQLLNFINLKVQKLFKKGNILAEERIKVVVNISSLF